MIDEYIWSLFAQQAMAERFDASAAANLADEMMKEFKKRFRRHPWSTPEVKQETENVYENKS